MKCDHVGAGEQLVHVCETTRGAAEGRGHVGCLDRGVRDEDGLETESGEKYGDPAPDSSESDDTRRQTRREAEWPEVGDAPGPLSQLPVGGGQTAKRRQNQGDGMKGDGVHAVVGDIDHPHPQ